MVTSLFFSVYIFLPYWSALRIIQQGPEKVPPIVKRKVKITIQILGISTELVTTPELKSEEEMSTTTEIQMEHCKCKVLSLLCKAKLISLTRVHKILPMLHLYQVHQFCHFYQKSKLQKQVVCIKELCDTQNSATFAPNQTQLSTQCMHTNTDLTYHKKNLFYLACVTKAI